MRCPNPDCREPFTVEEAKPKPKKGGTAPRPTHTSGKVGEVVPVVEAEAVKPRGFGSAKPPKPTGPAVTPDLPPIFADPDEPEVVEAQVVEAKVLTPPPLPKPPRIVEAKVVEAQVLAPPPGGPKEVVWSPDADVPLPGAPPLPKPKIDNFEVIDEPESVEEEVFIRRRKKKRNLAPILLIGLVCVTVILGGAIFAYLSRVHTASEEQEAAEALEQYKKGDYGPSAKSHDELATKYPGSKNADKYKFLADLSAMRQAVSAVTAQDNPKASIERMRGFIDGYKDSPFAKPDPFGQDIFAAGRKVLEDVEKKAKDHINTFKADRRNKLDELNKAEEMLKIGHEFVPVLKEFRTKEDKSLEELREGLDKEMKGLIAYERKRLQVLETARKIVEVPTDQAIQDAKTHLAQNDLLTDEESQEIIRTAEANFLKAIRFEREPANPQAPPPAPASLLFVAPVGVVKTGPRTVEPHDATVFLAIAKEVLYALDEETGDLLWAARVGAGVVDPPTIARVALPEGPTDVALVASNVAGKPAITAYVLRTGMPRWSQPLEPKVAPGGDITKLPPSPAAGPAVVAGSRAYVPVRDASGSVLVFDIATGMKIGRITVGQAIGPGAFLRPGTSHLYIAADSRRLFVFDVEAVASGGDAQCLRVIPTDHPTGTLRSIPTILGQPGDEPGPRFLLLSQADGASSERAMKLRAIPLPPTPAVAPESPPVLEPLPPAAELPLNGWAWFAPVSDSERLTVVTDRNQFRIFGINQPGNNDKPLFPVPSPAIPEPPGDAIVRGLVVPAEEGAYWVLVGGSLLKYRLTLLPDRGLTLIPAGAGLPIGEPTQPAQLNARRDTACFVVGSANSSGSRAVAVKLRDGEPLWQRQLGIIPSAAPIKTDAGLLMVDGDGGAIAIPAAAASAIRPAPEWIAAPPIDGVSGPTRLIATPDGKLAFTLTPVGEGAVAKWIIRRATNGKFDHTGSVTAPAPLAGLPAIINGTLLVPAADGFIHRLVIGNGTSIEDKLTPGPKWQLARGGETPKCFITVLSNETFLTSDGGKLLKRWNWPAGGGGWADDNASWTVRAPISAAPLVLPAAAGKPARMLVADATGGMSLYALDRPDPLRRWIPGVTPALPTGRVAPHFAFQTDATGRQLVAYTVDEKKVVCLDVDADDPKWITAGGEDAASHLVGSPVSAGGGRWLVTDLGGRIAVLNAEAGQAVLTKEVGLPGAVPAVAAVLLDPAHALVPLSDGTAALVDLALPKE